MAALFEDEQMDTIECESAEAALATLLIGGRKVAMIFADVRLRGVMDGIDLAREVKMRWPFLPVILTSGHPREHVGKLPPGVAYMPKPWQPLNVLIGACDRCFFFGASLPASAAVDAARISRSAASQCCSAWPCMQPCAAQIS